MPLLNVVFPIFLPVAPIPGSHLARVFEDFEIWLELYDGQRMRLATIEAGFVTDGVSRPGFVSWWLKRWGLEREEAILHDWLLYLYRSGRFGGPKFLVDLVFLLALVCGKRSFFRSMVMFFGVRTRS